MKIKEVVCALERFAPLPLQDWFDNAGLQIGLQDVEVTGVLLCLDVTEAVIDEAITLGCNFIISHHPFLFKGYKSITGKDYIERCIIKAIKNEITIYSSHTNLDNASGGVNFKIAEKIGLKNVQILAPKEDNLLKLVTYAPSTHVDNVRNALFIAGCGNIGNYDSCSYNSVEKGTFRAKEGATPFCGTIGELHQGVEVKIETILPSFNCGGAGAFLLPQAIRSKADVFITGEMKYHDYFGYEANILIAEIGHYESERYNSEVIQFAILDLFTNHWIHISKTNINPIKYL
ncbi:hypothetical protein EZS27_011470 [termite gut metagenome]|uniref:GTP cyclohydrolase 1 type 2 n=1 Tax=termite gut metagenome TaxID=433724 RepID=A0A5J4S5Q1_9ZZZZ